MALLPDPTTAASERSSVKNRLTGCRRRGSGINRHRSRTLAKRVLEGSRHRVQAHPESLGGVRGPGEVRGGCRARGSATSRKTRKIRQTFRSCLSSLLRSIQDCVQEVPAGQMAQGTPPSAHAAAFSKSSSVMSSVLFLYSPKSCKLQIVPASKRKQRRLSHGFVTGSYNSCI